ncbi:MAG: BspA family leucine-rich repeat surface protein [Bacteroidota bacterium]
MTARFTFFCLLFISTFLNAQQWTQLDGPYGANVEEMVILDGVIFVNASNKLYQSVDSGETWEQVITPLLTIDKSILALKEYNGVLYASVQSLGILTSQNLGQSWNSLNVFGNYGSILVDGDNIYIAYRNTSGISVSNNSGETWTELGGGIGNAFISALAKYNSKIYAGGNDKLFESSDNGQTWLEINVPEIQSYGINSMLGDVSGLYITIDHTVQVASGNLDDWEIVFEGDFIQRMGKIGENIFLPTFSKYYIGSNPQYDWQLEELPDFIGTVWDIEEVNGKTILATSKGILVREANSSQWMNKNTGLNGLLVNDMGSYQDQLLAGTSSGLRIYNPAENAWSSVLGQFPENNQLDIRDVEVVGGRVIVSTGQTLYSYDFLNAGNWKLEVELGSGTNYFGQDNNVFLASTYNSTFWSFDGGITWEERPLTGDLTDKNLLDAKLSNDRAVLITNDQLIYESYDYGETWQSVEITQELRDLNSPQLYAYDIQLAHNGIYITTSNGVFFRDDETGGWSSFNNLQDNAFKLEIDGERLYVTSLSKGGIYATTKSRNNWLPFISNDFASLPGIFFDDNFIYAHTSSGIWTMSKTELDILENERPFVTVWKTDNPGASADNQITIPMLSGPFPYNYNVDWGDGTQDSGLSGSITHTYEVPGTYEVSITGVFPGINFAGGFTNSEPGDELKILEVKNWGSIKWRSLFVAFSGCSNLDVTATDIPDFRNLDLMASMFFKCPALKFNASINDWDVSNVTSLSGIFREATSFNQDISNWNVSGITNFQSMFEGATSFNQDLSGWDVSKVESMRNTFANSGLSDENYDKLLTAWSQLPNLNNDVELGASTNFYCAADARQTLIDDYGWIITDAGPETNPPVAICSPFELFLDEEGNGVLLPENVDGGSSDECSEVTLSLSKTDFTTEDLGLNTIVLTVTDANGNMATCETSVTVSAFTEACPDDLSNESSDIVLPMGTLESGVDEVMGTSSETNGSECAIGVTNVDVGQPWGRYRISLDLLAQGLQAGDQLEIGIDGKDGTGNARIEINVDNVPNSSLVWSNFGSDWSRFDSTVTVPEGANTLDIWLFSNYADRTSAGTAYYDNLSIIKVDDIINDCPDDLANESADIILPSGTLESGVDEVKGTSEETSGSECAIGVTNVDVGQPWGRYRISLDLLAQGLQAGDRLEIGIDGKDGTGNARMEVNVDNVPNSSLAWSNFGSDWSRYSSTVTVPVGASTLDIWLFSNYADRNSQGTAYYDNLSIVKVDDIIDECPDYLANESLDIILPAGTLESGVDEVEGTSEETNESECAIGVTNVDTAQPWGRYRITIDLAAQGLQAGDQLEIGVDGKDGTGNARMEVNVDNIPNSSLIWSNFGEDWSRFSGTVTIPADAATLDIWLFSNYADRDIAGTAYYDNLSVVKIGSSEASNSMVVYPNPSQNVFRLTFETPKELSQVFIYDVQGKLVKVSEEATGSNSSEYDVSDLPPGMYFVIAQDENGDSFQKPIVIQR